MYKQVNTMTDEQTQMIKETENVKNKTKQIGIRIMKKCDEIEDIAELSKIMLDDNTICIETISENVDELDAKVQESKSLSKQFASWFTIFRSTKITRSQYTIKEKNKEANVKKTLPEKKIKEYEFTSDDPAEEIAQKLEERMDILTRYANGYNETLNKQSPLLDRISDKINKSECDIKNITTKINTY